MYKSSQSCLSIVNFLDIAIIAVEINGLGFFLGGGLLDYFEIVQK